MPLVNWSRDLSVKVLAIDQQHKKLIKMINDFHDSIVTQKPKDAISHLIDGLAKYTVEHFEYEEKLFRKLGYTQTHTHIREHNQFREKVVDLQKRFAAGNVPPSVELSHFMRKWLTEHIQGSDKKYSEFFNENGVY